jgi:hypothetical protein
VFRMGILIVSLPILDMVRLPDDVDAPIPGILWGGGI